MRIDLIGERSEAKKVKLGLASLLRRCNDENNERYRFDHRIIIAGMMVVFVAIVFILLIGYSFD